VGKNIVYSLFISVIAAGYVAALINLYLSHERADLIPGMTLQDVVTHFHGSASVTRLTHMINTSMRQYLETDDEKHAIEEWVGRGASEVEYPSVRPIFQNRCIKCHDMFGKAEFAPLTTLDEIHRYTAAKEGVSWSHIARVSHQHLFGMGLIFWSIGLILFRTPRIMTFKSILLALALISVFVDIAGWSLTKLHPGFALLVVGAGALHAACFAVIAMVCLYEMWVLRAHDL